MPRLAISRRRAAAALLLVGLAVGLAADLPLLFERRVRAVLVREAAARGMELGVGSVRWRFPATLELSDVVAEGRGLEAIASRVAFRLRPALSARRALRAVALERAVASLPGDLVVRIPSAEWDVVRLGREEVRLSESAGPGRLVLRRTADGFDVEAHRLELGRLVRIRFGGAEPLLPGTVSGAASLRRADALGWSWDLMAEGEGLRLASLTEEENAPRFGAPVNFSLGASGRAYPAERRLDVACSRLQLAGATVEAEGAFAARDHDVWAEGSLHLPNASVAELLATSGIAMTAAGGDLGSVALELTASGHLKDPSSIVVDQELRFRPPAAPPPELAALRAPFAATLDGPQGPHEVDLRPGSPGFVPLEEVPPLFLRTLLISEDAGFWGHPGIDLREVPVAFAVNWSRGEKARGASTITQQLAKNLFLSRKKSYARKLQELALTLLLESTLGKRRILEIYLNVIEWGPNVYGLRAAARHYFGKEPAELSPREGAFLVALIPGPLKYQSSFKNGALTPRFAFLVDSLLAKLRSVDALSEEEYLAARSQELAFAREDASGSPPEAPRTDGPEPPGPSPEATPAPDR